MRTLFLLLSQVHAFADGVGEFFFVHILGIFRGCFIGIHAFLDELGVDVARTEVGILEDFLVQGNGGLYAVNAEFLERTFHDFDGVTTGAAMNDDFGNHGIVVRLDGKTCRYAGVEADAGAAGFVQEGNLSRAGHEVVVRVLGVDAALDGMAGEVHIFLGDFQGFTSGNANLGAYEVNARNGFGDAMLNLNARVDFHEVEFVVGQVKQEFYRTDVGIMYALGSLYCKTAYAVAHILREGDGRRFFQKLLVAALQGAFTLAQVEHFTVVIGHNLHFDMAGTFNIMFEIILGLGDVHQQIQDVLEVVFVMGNAHTLAAATGNRLQDNGIANLGRNLDGFFIAGQRVTALGHRNAGRSDGSAGDILVADKADGFRHGANPGDAGFRYLFGKVCIFGEETIKRLNNENPDIDWKSEMEGLRDFILERPPFQFDCKVWNVPTENDVYAWFLYRQLDCIRNSKQQTAQTWLPHRELEGKSSDLQIETLKREKDIDWNTFEPEVKYGRLIQKVDEEVKIPEQYVKDGNDTTIRGVWKPFPMWVLSEEDGKKKLMELIKLEKDA